MGTGSAVNERDDLQRCLRCISRELQVHIDEMIRLLGDRVDAKKKFGEDTAVEMELLAAVRGWG